MSFFLFNILLGVTVYYSDDLILYLTFLIYVLDGIMLVYFTCISHNMKNKYPVVYYIIVSILSIVFIISLVILVSSLIYFYISSIKLLFKIWSDSRQKATITYKNDFFYEKKKNKNACFYDEGEPESKKDKPAGYGSKGAGKSKEERDKDLEDLDPETRRKKQYQRDYHRIRKEQRKNNPELDKAFKEKQKAANRNYTDKNKGNLEMKQRKKLYDEKYKEKRTPEQKEHKAKLDKESKERRMNKIKEEGRSFEHWLHQKHVRDEYIENNRSKINKVRRKHHRKNKDAINENKRNKYILHKDYINSKRNKD